MSDIDRRLNRLEEPTSPEEDVEARKHYVLWIGQDELPPDDLRPQDTVVYLPRKIDDPDEWYRQSVEFLARSKEAHDEDEDDDQD